MTFQEIRRAKEISREKRRGNLGRAGLFIFCTIFFYVCMIIN